MINEREFDVRKLLFSCKKGIFLVILWSENQIIT